MKIVIAIDVQNDFIDGSLGVDKDHVIADKISEYIRMCRKNGILTIATRDIHNRNEYPSTLEGKMLPISHCVEGTVGSCLYSPLSFLVDRVFEKRTFMSKDLGEAVENLVADYDVKEIEIFGFCTSICVASNALYLRGLLPNTKITVVENLCGDTTQSNHEAGLAVMNNCQIVSKTINV